MTIRRLTLADLPACLALAADRDWQPEAHKWRLLLEGGEAFGIDDADGGLAGSVVLTRYGDALAAVGMMLVAARREGRGLGRRLMTHLLDRAGDATVFLTATPLGRPLYEKLGFRAIGAVTTHVGPFAGRPGRRLAPPRYRPTSPRSSRSTPRPTAATAPASCGATSRRPSASASSSATARSSPTAPRCATPSRTSLGPVIGGDAGLLADLAAGLDGDVRLDLDHRLGDLVAFARGAGLAPADSVTLMVRGDRELPGDRARVTAPMMMAVG